MNPSWIGFFLSIAVLLIASRKNLSLALISGSIVLGLATLSPADTIKSITETLTSPPALLLSFAMGLFPVLGVVLQKTGALDDLIDNLRIKKKVFLPFSAAFIGLLPVPGGALISAPLIKKAAGKLPQERSFIINIWFRHVLILIYPLSPSLLVPAKMANVNVYEVIPFLFPFFLLMIALGYVFLLRDIKEENTKSKYDKRKLVIPIAILLMPLVLDIALNGAFHIKPRELTTFVAVLCALIAAIIIGKLDGKKALDAIKESKPWKFVLIILSMFMYIDIFILSGIGELISTLNVPIIVLCVIIAFLLAFVTGRTQLSASVIIPAYLGISAASSMPLVIFALTFVSIFLGYLISPLHPCISMSLEYFETSLGSALKAMAPMTLIALCVAFLLFAFV